MRILLVGTGGVGAAFAAIAARRTFYDAIVVADYDVRRPRGQRRSTTASSRRRSTPPTPPR